MARTFFNIHTEEFIKNELAKEGWELLSKYIKTEEPILVRNPDFFNGHVCSTKYHHWRIGKRPSMQSLICPESYIQEVIGEEGWTLLSKYKNGSSKLLMRDEKLFMGETVQFSWSNWLIGKRPNISSLVNRNQYIEKVIGKEGWTLIDSDVKSTGRIILIKNNNMFGGEPCEIRWDVWCSGGRPNFKSIVNKTRYIKSYLIGYDYEIKDIEWKYEHSLAPINIRHVVDGEEYIVSWNRITSGMLPRSPKAAIKSRIKHFLVGKKNFSISEKFDEEYWMLLKRQFPIIPKGWHIDHIVCLSFWNNTWEQMRLANDPRNLRLLPAKENMARNNRLRASELDEYGLWDLYYQAENPMGYKLIEDRYDLAS